MLYTAIYSWKRSWYWNCRPICRYLFSCNLDIPLIHRISLTWISWSTIVRSQLFPFKDQTLIWRWTWSSNGFFAEIRDYSASGFSWLWTIFFIVSNSYTNKRHISHSNFRWFHWLDTWPSSREGRITCLGEGKAVFPSILETVVLIAMLSHMYCSNLSLNSPIQLRGLLLGAHRTQIHAGLSTTSQSNADAYETMEMRARLMLEKFSYFLKKITQSFFGNQAFTL